MRNGKALINLTIIVFVLFLGVLAIIPNNDAHSSTLRGYIAPEETNKEDYYRSSILRYNDPEPNWKPQQVAGYKTDLEINGVAGMLVDINTGTVLYEKNPAKKYPIASLVKIMTAIVAIEHKNLDDEIYVSKLAATVGENSMGVSIAETYTLEELLYGLILHSGNDAAYAIAEGVGGTEEQFVEWMNFKARELGMRNSYFADPSGLDDATYSTPEDLVKLTRYALKFSELRKIAKTVEQEIPSNKNHKYLYLYNQTNLLTTYPGVQGFKTGFTEDAGLCLITYATNGGKEVVGIVLNSADRKGDMILMLDHGFRTLGINVEHNLL